MSESNPSEFSEGDGAQNEECISRNMGQDDSLRNLDLCCGRGCCPRGRALSAFGGSRRSSLRTAIALDWLNNRDKDESK